MKTLTIKVPDELFAEIAKAAEIRRVPKSEIARERLEGNRKAGGASGQTLWERMENPVISDDSLPKDLSANKAHLKGYGKRHPD